MDEKTVVIGEDRLTFFERDTMLPLVESVLALVPYKSEIVHTYSVTTRYLHVNSLFKGPKCKRDRRLQRLVGQSSFLVLCA